MTARRQSSWRIPRVRGRLDCRIRWVASSSRVGAHCSRSRGAGETLSRRGPGPKARRAPAHPSRAHATTRRQDGDPRSPAGLPGVEVTVPHLRDTMPYAHRHASRPPFEARAEGPVNARESATGSSQTPSGCKWAEAVGGATLRRGRHVVPSVGGAAQVVLDDVAI